MKKNLLLKNKWWFSTVVLGIMLLFSANVSGQAASATWALTTDGASVVSPSVNPTISAGSLTYITPPTGTPANNGISNVSFSATNGVGSQNWGSSSRNAFDYYQYSIAPTSCINLEVTSIKFNHFRSGNAGQFAIYYSLDGWVNATQIGIDASIPGTSTEVTQSVSINVPYGKTLLVRIFAWNLQNNNSYYYNKGVQISGTTTNITPVPDDPADVTACDSYTLPALTVGTYYTGPGKTGTMKSAGDVITASTTLYVYAETGTTPNCWAENSFDITINVTPTPDDPADVTACDSYTLPALTVGTYYTGPGKTGTMKSAGDVITASTTLYVYAETGTTPNCWAENSFDITINVTPTPDDPADVTACDSYTLPALTVGTYYTGPGKTGTMKSAGDVITASTTLYVYAETGTTPNCWAENSFDITINVTPTPDDPADVTACDSYTLPALTVGTYYTGPGKTGTMKSAGDAITASTTLYVYAETGTTPNCWAENSFDININLTPTITPDPTAINVKYSEEVEVSVIFADEDVENLLINIEWKEVGSSSYTSGLPGDLSFDEISTGEWEITGNVFLAVGDYEIRITADDGECEGELIIPMTVTCEDALVEYVGGTYFTTNTKGSGFVFLETTVVDEDNIGDVTNATITFKDGSNVLGTPNIPVGLVNNSITTVGYTTTNFNHQLNSSEMSGGGKSWEVVAYVGGDYYCGESEPVVVTLAMPGSEYVTGGGYTILTEAVSGQFPGLPGKKMNFGFVMKWNKSGKNLQGNVNIIYRAEDGSHYKIKSNRINTLSVDESDGYKKATLSTQANLVKVLADGTEVGLGGNRTLVVQAWESVNEKTGKEDMISVQLSGQGGSGIAFTSNWSNNRTATQLIDGGKIQVGLGSSSSPSKKSAFSSFSEDEVSLHVYPNPFREKLFFDLVWNEDADARLEIFDIRGVKVSTVYNNRVNAGQLYRIEFAPENIPTGMLLYRLTIGGEVTNGKVLFQPEK